MLDALTKVDVVIAWLSIRGHGRADGNHDSPLLNHSSRCFSAGPWCHPTDRNTEDEGPATTSLVISCQISYIIYDFLLVTFLFLASSNHTQSCCSPCKFALAPPVLTSSFPHAHFYASEQVFLPFCIPLKFTCRYKIEMVSLTGRINLDDFLGSVDFFQQGPRFCRAILRPCNLWPRARWTWVLP